MPFPCHLHLATAIWDWYASDNKLPGTGRGSSKGHKLASCKHAANMPSPCHCLERSLTERHISGMAEERHGNGMACVNQTRPHYVNQTGKTQSNHLAVRHGRGTAGERHGNGMVCVNPPLEGCSASSSIAGSLRWRHYAPSNGQLLTCWLGVTSQKTGRQTLQSLLVIKHLSWLCATGCRSVVYQRHYK
jgi:hypothetical protein